MEKLKVWINGRLVGRDHAKVSVFDRGFLYGEGLFETMRSYAGAVFMIDAHIDRLFRSLKLINIRPSYSKSSLKKAVYDTLRANLLADAYIRITVTKGDGGLGMSPERKTPANVVIMVKKFHEYPINIYSKGIKAISADIRQNEYSPMAKMKSLNFLPYILARREAMRKGFSEAILLNTKGFVAECAAGNIFIVKKGKVITPSIDSGILTGITRGVVKRILKNDLGLIIRDRPVRYQELMGADEVFTTNSLVGIIAVTCVDSKTIDNGSEGKITEAIRGLYNEHVRSVCLR